MRRRAQAAAAAEYPAAAHCAGLRPRLGRPPCAPTSAPGARTPGTCGGWSFSEQASRSGPAQRPEPPGLGAHGSGECHRGEVEDPSAATDDGTSGRGARGEERGARSAERGAVRRRGRSSRFLRVAHPGPLCERGAGREGPGGVGACGCGRGISSRAEPAGGREVVGLGPRPRRGEVAARRPLLRAHTKFS